MKELSIEEKAKAYDEAIERAKKHCADYIVETIFPELKESEGERIIKAIKSAVLQLTDIYLQEKYGLKQSDCIAWLEKQGEQSSDILHDVNEEPEEQREIFCEWESSDAIWHDVAFYHADTKTFWHGGQKIEDVVKWAYVNEMLEKQGEQNPAWSEDDEKCFENAIMYCEWARDKAPDLHCYETSKKSINWLKSLKDRVQPQPKQEWSEDDEIVLNNLIYALANDRIGNNRDEYVNWLKSLRPQNRWKPSDEQMKALDDVISSRDIKYEVLSELWKDLKKLRGE